MIKFQPVYGSLFVSAENRYIISDSNQKPSYEYIKKMIIRQMLTAVLLLLPGLVMADTDDPFLVIAI